MLYWHTLCHSSQLAINKVIYFLLCLHGVQTHRIIQEMSVQTGYVD